KVGSPPVGPKDGEPIEALRDGVIDRGLREDRVYHYGIHARYKGPDGQLRMAPGVVVSAMPHRPVEAIGELKIRAESEGRLGLSWREPSKGQVRILRTHRPLARSRGEHLTTAEAESLEGHWLDPTEPGQAVDARPPASGVCYYTPMTLWG